MIINESLFNTFMDSDLLSNMEYIEHDQSNNYRNFSLIEFSLENDNLKKKGLAVQDIESLSQKELRIVAQKLADLTNWNKFNADK